MKFSVVLLVLACASSAYGDGAAKHQCLQGTVAEVGKAPTTKKDCAGAETTCQGPFYNPEKGYAKDTAVEFKCGDCATGKGVTCDSGATIAFKEFHKNDCYKWTYDDTAKKWEVETKKDGDKDVKQTKSCHGETKEKKTCKRPLDEQEKAASWEPCGKCPAESEKKCKDCDTDKCNSAGALIASLVPLLALLYTLL